MISEQLLCRLETLLPPLIQGMSPIVGHIRRHGKNGQNFLTNLT